METVIVQSLDSNIRLDVFLASYYKKTRSHFQALNKDNKILVNNTKVKNGYLLILNDVITIDNTLSPLDTTPIKMDLDIIYENSNLLVVNKPRGLVVHPALSYKGPTLVNGLLEKIKDLSGINGVIRPGIVHRIDKDTSGLLVVAKNDETHVYLQKELKNNKIERTYVALVWGTFGNDKLKGTITTFITRDPNNRLKYKVSDNGKKAISHYEVIKQFERYSLVSVSLETGRTHQIRVHLSFINHPIIGDPIYGLKNDKDQSGQYLHAKRLAFRDIKTNKLLVFDSNIPSYFDKYIK
ncbi:MAG: RluA family pseudouridine synthase [Acholeplasmatales bacterium]|jgi:23S rRNA pseudouridine1911/1915/1917 synthase|nr:RluA family pseudouridine synthase [Acholeplasmatales bacterium]